MKKKERHKPTASDVLLIVPVRLLGAIFISFFLMASSLITYQLIDWLVHSYSRLRPKDVVVITLLLILCFGSVLFCAIWLFRTLQNAAQRAGVMKTEVDIPDRAEVAVAIDLFLSEPYPYPFDSEIELMLEGQSFKEDPLLAEAQSTVSAVLTEYQNYGSDSIGLRPDHFQRLQEISRKLRG